MARKHIDIVKRSPQPEESLPRPKAPTPPVASENKPEPSAKEAAQKAAPPVEPANTNDSLPTPVLVLLIVAIVAILGFIFYLYTI